jgi:hypothetical protein
MKNKSWNEREVGALWFNPDGKNGAFYNGKINLLGGTKYELYAFRNKDKTPHNGQPTLKLFLGKPLKPELPLSDNHFNLDPDEFDN